MIEPPASATESSPGLIRPGIANVLLVEDNPGDARLVSECLRTRLGGCFVLDQAETLGSALTLLEGSDYDVALVDLGLPDSAGVETLEAVRLEAPLLPVIVLTGLNDERTALECIRAGAQDYVIKGQHDAEVLVRTMSFAIKRCQAERALRESEGRYRNLFERNLAGVYLTDQSGRILDCNDAFAKILGAAEKRDLFDTPAWDLYLDPDQAAALRGELDASRELKNHRLDLRRIDGQPVHVLANISWLNSDVGCPLVQGTIIDITEGQQLRDRLCRSYKLEAIGSLAGGVAHDFNNLLTSITGYTELSLEAVDAGSPVHGNLEEIRQAARRAALLTQQLLAFSRRQILNPRRLEVNDLVTSLERLISSALGDGIILTVRASEDAGEVVVDRGQLETALMNLALRAREAMPDGGELTIETSRVELGGDWVREHSGAAGGPHVMLALRDTGAGMDAEALKRVFEPFSELELPNRSRLGLAAAYGIIIQSGGYVDVESGPSGGSTFKIYLPVADVESVDEASETALATEVAEKTILLVEDDDVLRRMSERVLLGQGYEVLTAGDPAEALNLAGESDFDLLVSDVVMPGMSGLDLARSLTADRPELKVLLMSGYPSDICSQEDSLPSPIAFLGKPFKPSDLTREIRAVIAGVEPETRLAS